jgi:uncharacterized damage-inducible protein DinB
VSGLEPLATDWAGYHRRVVDALRAMSDEDLALEVATHRGPGIDPWPIWAVAAHTAGARVYWLCHVLGEPGADQTPFADPSGFGWEDDLATVRSRDEVVAAYDSTWPIVAAALARWTPEMLGESIRREGRTGVQVHTRQSILLRLITHEAYHAGELSLTLSANGREPIDLWPHADWLEAPATP